MSGFESVLLLQKVTNVSKKRIAPLRPAESGEECGEGEGEKYT
jgi:hypothetical protein